ncbi:hypothetical protein EfmJHP36_32300 (plasmid) [Enterococcus faecium]|nr:hypothetical protein EfmJHP36_32300 [Enterococcus faecium]
MQYLQISFQIYRSVVNAGRLIKEGRAQVVKLEGGIEVCDKIEAIVKASIPVMAHIGLTPQSVNAFGGFKVQGKDKEAAKELSSNLVLGLINTSVTYLIQCGFTEKMAIEALYPLIEFNIRNIKEKGIIESLTGPVERCDISTIKGHCEVLSDEDRALYMLLSKKYIEEVKDGVFPGPEHGFKISDGELGEK